MLESNVSLALSSNPGTAVPQTTALRYPPVMGAPHLVRMPAVNTVPARHIKIGFSPGTYRGI
jgi:hypothetical protein